MTYRGRVENGVIVLEPGARLPEGIDVKIETMTNEEGAPVDPHDLERLRAGLLSFSGVIKGGPPDLARNHDHYLHGTPRK